jgi:hypothetical protein
MDLRTVRHYLSLPPRTTAEEVMRDAVLVSDPGALFILNLVLDVRAGFDNRVFTHVVMGDIPDHAPSF